MPLKTKATASSSEPVQKKQKLDSEDLFSSSLRSPNGTASVTLPSGAVFNVHIDILAARSPYFKAALTGGFSEGVSKNINLEEASDEAFSRILKWFYGQDIRRADAEKSLERTVSDLSFSLLVEIWILADYFAIPKLQNHAMDILANKIYKHKFPHASWRLNLLDDDQVREVRDVVSLLWQKVEGNTTLLKEFFLDIIGNPRFVKDIEILKTWDLPNETLFDVLNQCFKRQIRIGSSLERMRIALETYQMDEDWDWFHECPFENMEKTMEDCNESTHVRAKKYYVATEANGAKSTK